MPHKPRRRRPGAPADDKASRASRRKPPPTSGHEPPPTPHSSITPASRREPAPPREPAPASPRDGREPAPVPDRSALRADCANCFALCCVALPFAASADFAVDKPGGTPCTHLRADFRCGIHARLRSSGFPGCTVFDCFGAGQQVSQVTFAGRDWRGGSGGDGGRGMFDAFAVMRQLHELLWYLTEALALPRARPFEKRLRQAADRTERHTRAGAGALAALDVAAHRDAVSTLLLHVSEHERAGLPGRRKNHRGADLIGARLPGAALRGASLRGARLVAADLNGADLTRADLIGADLRDTDLRGADLTGALFLTPSQLAAARGDAATRIPPALDRPAHWTASPPTAHRLG